MATFATAALGSWPAEAAEDLLDPRRVAGDFNGDSVTDYAFLRPLFDCGKGRVEIRDGDDGSITVLSREDAAIAGTATCHDYFGAAAAVGDFNDDGYDDIVIGTPGDNSSSVTHSGGINILYGSAGGISTSGDQLLHQNNGTIPDSNDAYDYFGDALASGDFNCDGWDDIAIGIPREDISTSDEAGFVIVLNGSACGVTVAASLCNTVSIDGPTYYREGFSGVDGTIGTADHFGAGLAAGNFDNADCDDLAIGVPNDDDTATDAGYVYVLHGQTTGLDTTGDYTLEQGVGGISGTADADDRFGERLAAKDYDADGIDELYVSVPGEVSGDRPWTHLFFSSAFGFGSDDLLAGHPHDSCEPISDPLGKFPLVVEMAALENWIGAAADDEDRFPEGGGGGAWADYVDAAAFFGTENANLAGIWTRYTDVIEALVASGVNDSSTQLQLIGFLPYLGGPNNTTPPSTRALGGIDDLHTEVEDLVDDLAAYDPVEDGPYSPSWFVGWRTPGEYFADSSFWAYRYTRELRRAVDIHDSTLDRTVFGYIQTISRPGVEWVANSHAAWSPDHSVQPNLLDDVWDDVSSYSGAVELDALSNVHKASPDGSSVSDYYGENNGTWASIQLMREATGAAIPVCDDTTQGAYAHLYLTENGSCPTDFGDEHRIWSYHMSRLVNEGVENTLDVQIAGSVDCHEQRAFYMPDLSVNSAGMTSAHARHDFWVGIHESWGVWLHNFVYAIDPGTAEPTAAWDSYREGLALLKSGGLRDAILGGRMVVVPELGVPSSGGPYTTQTTTDGDEALPCLTNQFGLGNVMAMPAYTGVQATLVVDGTTGHLIITNSIGLDALSLDPVQYKIALQGSVSSITQVIGTTGLGCGSQPSNVICDTFDDIDARVYEIEFSSAPDWPPLPEGWIAERFNER